MKCVFILVFNRATHRRNVECDTCYPVSIHASKACGMTWRVGRLVCGGYITSVRVCSMGHGKEEQFGCLYVLYCVCVMCVNA